METPAEWRIWTLSNALSFLRIVLIVPVGILIWNDGDRIVLGVLVFTAGLTDLFDGMLARALNQVSEFGKVLDPLADKLCIGIIGAVLTLKGMLPLWFVAFAIVRDLVILAGGMKVKRATGLILQSNLAGKWASATISFLVLALVLRMPSLALTEQALLGISTGLLIISSAQYYTRYRNVMAGF